MSGGSTKPRPSARVYRRRRVVVFSALAVVLALLTTGGIYSANALGAPIPAAQPVITDPEPVVAAPQALSLPGFGTYAVGAVGFDGLLAAGDEQRPMPMASITKVITALVVLEANPIPAGEGGPEIAYTEADVDIYWDQVAQNSSVAPVVAGSTLTLRESLEAMLLPSGGNYSISIANWAFGSVDGFLERARVWLNEHGLVNTRLVDTSGLSLEDVSTAAEIVELGKIAIAEPIIAEIVSMQSADIPELGTLKNGNRLLGTHGVDGIKTGTTDDAANLLFSRTTPWAVERDRGGGAARRRHPRGAERRHRGAPRLDRARIPRSDPARSEPDARRVRDPVGRDGASPHDGRGIRRRLERHAGRRRGARRPADASQIVATRSARPWCRARRARRSRFRQCSTPHSTNLGHGGAFQNPGALDPTKVAQSDGEPEQASGSFAEMAAPEDWWRMPTGAGPLAPTYSRAHEEVFDARLPPGALRRRRVELDRLKVVRDVQRREHRACHRSGGRAS